MFSLPCQQQSGRQPYAGRRSLPADRRELPQPVIPIRPTTAADVTLRQAANPWKPARSQLTAADGGGAADAPADEETESRKAVKRVRGILNRLTPTNKADLLTEFLAIPIDSDAIRVDVVALLCDKAVDEPQYCKIYSEMAASRVQAELTTSGRNKSVFRYQIVLRCQQMFEQATTNSSKKADLAADFASIADVRLAAMSDVCDRRLQKDERAKARVLHDDAVTVGRRRILANIRFVGELFKVNLLVESIFHYCVDYLLQRSGVVLTAKRGGRAILPKTIDDEEAVESAIRLLEIIAPVIVKKASAVPRATPEDVAKVGSYMAIIRGIRGVCSNRVAFAIDDLVEQSRNNWVKRREKDGPKTIAAIHRDFALDLRNLSPTGQLPQMSWLGATNPSNARLPAHSRHAEVPVKLGPTG